MNQKFPKPKDAEGRIKLSDYEWRKMRRGWWNRLFEMYGYATCELCGKSITDLDDFQIDHKQPRGMGGGNRDDRKENLQVSCAACNLDKGSKRVQNLD